MTRTVDICTNGINASPGHDDSWTDRFVTWMHLHTMRRAEKFEYYARTISRRWFSSQQERAEKLSRLITRYVNEGFTINLIGHSNGCDIITRALQLLPCLGNRPVVEDLHLFAAACDCDMYQNGLNEQLLTVKVWRAFVYVGEADFAMAMASLTPWAYGNLGRRGPSSIAKEIPCGTFSGDESAGDALRLITRVFPGYKHSSFFDQGERFEGTMRRIAGADLLG